MVMMTMEGQADSLRTFLMYLFIYLRLDIYLVGYGVERRKGRRGERGGERRQKGRSMEKGETDLSL